MANAATNHNTTDRYAHLPEATAAFYRAGVQALHDAGIPLLVGGAYALGTCTGIVRHTKDFDVFVKPEDVERTLTALNRSGFRTELTFPHWLGKAYNNGDFIDVIFSSGNGVATVDDDWFRHAAKARVLGMDELLVPPEEMIWSKSFVLERERYDGADIAHLLQSCAEALDWSRLLKRFGPWWRVLFSHLLLFGFIYPAERGRIPAHVMEELIDRLQKETTEAPPPGRVCQGTLLSREQYLTDITDWGYKDARLNSNVQMSAADIAHWTSAIEKEKNSHG